MNYLASVVPLNSASTNLIPKLSTRYLTETQIKQGDFIAISKLAELTRIPQREILSLVFEKYRAHLYCWRSSRSRKVLYLLPEEISNEIVKSFKNSI